MGGKEALLKHKIYQKLIIAVPRKATHCNLLPLISHSYRWYVSFGSKPDRIIKYFLWETLLFRYIHQPYDLGSFV